MVSNEAKTPGMWRGPVAACAAFAMLVLAAGASFPGEAQSKPHPKKPGTVTQGSASTPAAVAEVPVEEQKDAYLISGIAKRQQGKYREAVDDLTIYVSGNDRDPDGHWELAVAYSLYHSVRPVPAIRRKGVDAFRRCFELSPGVQRTLPPAAASRPTITAMVADARKAAGVAGEVAPSRSIDAEGLLRLSERQVEAGDLFEAKRNFDEMKALPPPPQPVEREQVRLKLVNALGGKILQIHSLEVSNVSQAQAEAGKLLRFFPDEPVALETYVRLQMRYSKLAMEGLIGQKLYQSYRNSIEGFMLKGQFQNALAEVNRLLFNFPRSEFGERKYEEILRKNDEALKIADDAFNAGRFEEARRKYEEIRANYPDPGTAQDAISEIDEVRRKLEMDLDRAKERGSYAAAYKTAKDLSAKFPSNVKAQEAVMASLADVSNRVKEGSTALEAGKTFEAITSYQRVLATVADQAEAQESLNAARASLRETKTKLWTMLEPVAAGTFILGGAYAESKPKNKQATLPLFFLDRQKASNANYRVFVMGAGMKAPESWKNGEMDPQKADFPMGGVSYAEADAFCRWVGKRLPTEFEWEKAARGPEGLDLPYDDAPGRLRKPFDPFQDYPVNRWPELASPFKIEGLVGPVFEWTSSWFVPYPGNDDAAIRNIPRDAFKVARGGSRSPSAPPSDKPLEVAWRERRRPDRRDADLGFRCAANEASAPEWLATDPEPEKVHEPPARPPAPAPGMSGGPAKK